MRLSLLLVLLAVGFAAAAAPPPACAQLLADTLFTWQGYGPAAQCRLRLYARLPDEDYTHVVVLQELAENRGPSTLDDARHLAALVGRAYGIDPAQAYWVFHWGGFSFEGGQADRRKEVFLRATFRPTSGGALGAPNWRLITRADVEDYTDRLFR